MAKGLKQQGDTLTFTAPYAVSSGQGFLVGVIFAIALNDAASGAPVEGRVRTGEVWELNKNVGEAWTAYVTKLYWDNTNRRVTSTASGNTFIGVAAAGALSAATVGLVILKQGWTA